MLKRFLNIPKFILKYFRKVSLELKHVEWLKRKTLLNYSILVVASIVLGTILILVIDQVFFLIKSKIIF